MPAIPTNPSTYALQTASDTAPAPDSSILFVHPFVGGTLWTTLFQYPTSNLTPSLTQLQIVDPDLISHFLAAHVISTHCPKTTLLILLLMSLLLLPQNVSFWTTGCKLLE